jgi:hypothetical protein
MTLQEEVLAKFRFFKILVNVRIIFFIASINSLFLYVGKLRFSENCVYARITWQNVKFPERN